MSNAISGHRSRRPESRTSRKIRERWRHLKKLRGELPKTDGPKANPYCQSESRFGLFTYVGRGLTAKGTRPVCPFQQVFRYTYLFGAYSPVDGDHFELLMPNCSSECFQTFLEHFARERKDQLNILQVDNAAFHKAKRPKLPDNVLLLFQPPYSLELNPAEKIWWRIKRAATNLNFPNMEGLVQFLTEQVNM